MLMPIPLPQLQQLNFFNQKIKRWNKNDRKSAI